MKKVTVVLLVLAIALTFAFAEGQTEATGEKPFKVGVIYISAPGDMGYSYQHAQGTKAMKEYFGDKVEVTELEGVPENDECTTAMEQLIGEGCQMIFANSYNYQEYMYKLAPKYPNVKFEHCSGYLKTDNMSNYFGRMYQMRYLSGMIAGKMSRTGKLGYVGAFNTPEVVRGINAFTLGARSVNPNATVQVVWTNSWFDPGLERDASVSLLDSGCDLIAQHQDTTEPAKAAVERGKYAIGYNADFAKIINNDNVLVSPMWNWGNYMIPAVQSAIDGTWKSEAYWGGLDDDMIKLSPISPLVPADFQAVVEKKLEEIKSDSFDVFWGQIKDNKGNLIQGPNAKMSDADMLSMQFFVEGVIGKVK
ncbi:MAG: BMP family ABC transporter substrate-binding protein [Sphaerochaetaceae bacterium]|nr:BMP family ABC transporter substrate-binding protein [Sphaerochaetaceae bacterium]